MAALERHHIQQIHFGPSGVHFSWKSLAGAAQTSPGAPVAAASSLTILSPSWGQSSVISRFTAGETEAGRLTQGHTRPPRQNYSPKPQRPQPALALQTGAHFAHQQGGYKGTTEQLASKSWDPSLHTSLHHPC